MPELPLATVIYYVGSALAAIWVVIDARTRLGQRPPWEVLVWGLGTALALPVFLPLYMLGSRAPDRSGQWGPVEMIGIAIFFGLTMPIVAGLAGLRPETLSLGVLSVVVLVQNAGFVLLSIVGVARRYRLPLARLGLTGRKWVAMLVLGLFVGGVMIPVASVTEQAAVEIYGLIRGRAAAELQMERERRMDPLNRVLESAQRPAAVGWLLALLGIAVPIGEEVYFRGVVYGGLRNRYGLGWGVLGSTVFFGVVHRQVVHFLPIAILGLALALLYERTKSLLPSIVVHGVNNIVSVLARLYNWNI